MPSQSGILAQACENLAETRNTNQRLVESLQQSEGVYAENERLSSQIEQLQQENALLNQQLQIHGSAAVDSKEHFLAATVLFEMKDVHFLRKLPRSAGGSPRVS